MPFAEWLHGQGAARTRPLGPAPVHHSSARPTQPRSGSVPATGPRNLVTAIEGMISSESEGVCADEFITSVFRFRGETGTARGSPGF